MPESHARCRKRVILVSPASVHATDGPRRRPPRTKLLRPGRSNERAADTPWMIGKPLSHLSRTVLYDMGRARSTEAVVVS